MNSSTPSHYNSLIAELRGLAITLIIIFHISHVIWPYSRLLYGHSGVDIFFFLSGYGIARGFRKEKTLIFLKRRFIAILPLYWIALTFFILIDNINGKPLSLENILTHYALVHVLFEQHMLEIDGSLWFISALFIFYIISALLRPAIQKGNIGIILSPVVFFIAGAGILYFHFEMPDENMRSIFFGRFPVFFAGLCAGCAARLGWKKLIINPASVISAIAITIYYMYIANPGFFMLVLFAGIWSLMHIIFSYYGKGMIHDTYLSYLKQANAYSYPLFLFHHPLISTYNPYKWLTILNENMDYASGMIIGAIGMIALIVWVFYFIRNFVKPLWWNW